MAAISDSALTSANDNNVVNQTAPESITPLLLGNNVLKVIIDSKWSRFDDLLTLPPVQLSKVGLATCIAGGTLVLRTNGLSDKQWIKITDRTDGNPLYVQINSANTISPFGIWVKAGKPLAVIMDYANGYDGEVNPFIAVFDENRQLNLPNKIIIADASKGAGKILVSDVNGQGTWLDLSSNYFQRVNLTPAGMTGGAPLMMGFSDGGYNITPTANKLGIVSITVTGEFTSADLAGDTNFRVKRNTGTAPINGAAETGNTWQTFKRKSYSATDRTPFSFNGIMQMSATGVPNWIDLAVYNDAGSAVNLYNVSISAHEI